MATSVPTRIAVTVGLLVLLSKLLDWQQVATRVEEGHWEWLAASVALLALALIVGAWRWYLLLHVAKLSCTWGATLRAFFLGSFANNFLPTGFGGDVVRALAVTSSGAGVARATTTVAVDRLTSIACLVILAWALLPFEAAAVPGAVTGGLAVITALAVAGAVTLRLAFNSRLVAGLVPGRLRPLAAELRVPLIMLGRSPAAAARVFALGVVYQAMTVGSFYAAARAVDIELSYVVAAATVPVVLVVTMLPISLAGFGLREGSYVVLLDGAGIAAGEATLISLLTVVVLALASAPGALAFIGFRRERAWHRPG